MEYLPALKRCQKARVNINTMSVIERPEMIKRLNGSDRHLHGDERNAKEPTFGNEMNEDVG